MAITLQIIFIMDLRSQLIECNKKRGTKRLKCSIVSIALHGVFFAFIIFMGATAAHKVDAEEKPMHAFLMAGAPPPPPPPPPPPAPSSAPKSTPTPVIKPVQVQTSFVQPHIIPKELPKVATTGPAVDTTPAQTPSGGEPGGVPGGGWSETR